MIYFNFYVRQISSFMYGRSVLKHSLNSYSLFCIIGTPTINVPSVLLEARLFENSKPNTKVGANLTEKYQKYCKPRLGIRAIYKLIVRKFECVQVLDLNWKFGGKWFSLDFFYTLIIIDTFFFKKLCLVLIQGHLDEMSTCFFIFVFQLTIISQIEKKKMYILKSIKAAVVIRCSNLANRPWKDKPRQQIRIYGIVWTPKGARSGVSTG